MQETALLVRMVAAVAPQQPIDSRTPEGWHELLKDVPFEDAKAALARISGRQPFISAADIMAGVRAVREERIDQVGVPTPNVDPDDTIAWVREKRALTHLVADGRMTLEGRAVYERGGRTLTNARPLRAITAEPVLVPPSPEARAAFKRAQESTRLPAKETKRPKKSGKSTPTATERT
jgi:hypothetical protein